MNWIDDFLAIGALEDATDYDRLREEQINLSIDVRCVFGGEFEAWAPIPDKMDSLVNILRMLTGMGYRIFIHCHGGIDRSPFVAMLYVHYKYQMNYGDAYKLVREKRPQTMEHWDWVDVVK